MLMLDANGYKAAANIGEQNISNSQVDRNKLPI